MNSVNSFGLWYEVSMARKVNLQVLLGVLLLIAVAACAKEPQQPMRLGLNQWTGYEPFYLARDKGYFMPTFIKLIEHPSASESMRLFRNGTIDAAALTLDETLQLLATGSDLEVVLVIDVSQGGDVLLAKPEIKSIKDLKGQRVGFESTALGAYMLTRALQTADMHPSEVLAVPLEFANVEAFYLEGKVDAVVTFEPIKTRLLSAGANIVFDSSQIPGEVVDVLVVQSGFAKKHTELVRQLLEGWFKAIDYLKHHEREAAELLAKRQKISPAQYILSQQGLRYPDLKENHHLLAGDKRALLPVAQRLSDFMLAARLISSAVDVRPRLSVNYLGGEGQ